MPLSPVRRPHKTIKDDTLMGASEVREAMVVSHIGTLVDASPTSLCAAIASPEPEDDEWIRLVKNA